MKNLIYLVALIATVLVSCEKNEKPEPPVTVDNRTDYFGTWKSTSITLNGVEQNFSKTFIFTKTTATTDGVFDTWKIENSKINLFDKFGDLFMYYTIINPPSNNIMKLKFLDPTNKEYYFIFKKQ